MGVQPNVVRDQSGPESRGQRCQQVAWVSGSLLCAAALVIIEFYHTQEYITIGNLDFFGMVDRAKLLPGDLSAWVQGYYPVGIPLLLRAGLALGLDVVCTGQLVSVLGGIVCLYGGALLALYLTRSRAMALLTMAYLLTTKAILAYAGYEGTDMLAAGLQVLALGVLARDPRQRRVVLVAGVVNGLAYLARYTAMVTFAVCLAYLLTMTLHRRERKNLWTVPIYALGFLLGALPQVVPSLLVKGTPFYQTQAYHIWIKLYANSDFVRIEWQPTPTEITLWELFRLDPRRFVANWWHEFSLFWTKTGVPLEDHPLAQLAKAGFFFAMLDVRRLSIEHRALLSFVVIGVVGILSIFTTKTRFLINMAPVLVVCALYFLWRLLPAHATLGKVRLPVNLSVLGLLWVALLPIPWEFAHTGGSDPRGEVIEISNMLRAAGAQTAQEIVSTNLGHQDVSSPTKDRYAMLYLIEAPPTVAELRQLALESGYRFLIYDSSRGLTYHPQYKELLWPETHLSGYTPVWAAPTWAEGDSRFAVYRFESDDPSPRVSTRVSMAGDISLVGYDLTLSENQPVGMGSRVGLYLYWQTREPLTESLKVFVHLLGPQENVVAQHDSVPAMWTYDTRDWEPGETVVDFHSMEISSDIEPGVYTIVVGLYEEGSGERWPTLDASGKPAADQVILTQIDFTDNLSSE
jgi:hypothetical protein